jgi:hypothetical protein
VAAVPSAASRAACAVATMCCSSQQVSASMKAALKSGVASALATTRLSSRCASLAQKRHSQLRGRRVDR